MVVVVVVVVVLLLLTATQPDLRLPHLFLFLSSSLLPANLTSYPTYSTSILHLLSSSRWSTFLVPLCYPACSSVGCHLLFTASHAAYNTHRSCLCPPAFTFDHYVLGFPPPLPLAGSELDYRVLKYYFTLSTSLASAHFCHHVQTLAFTRPKTSRKFRCCFCRSCDSLLSSLNTVSGNRQFLCSSLSYCLAIFCQRPCTTLKLRILPRVVTRSWQFYGERVPKSSLPDRRPGGAALQT